MSSRALHVSATKLFDDIGFAYLPFDSRYCSVFPSLARLDCAIGFGTRMTSLLGVFGSMVHEKNPRWVSGLRGHELPDTLRFRYASTFPAYSSRSSKFVVFVL